MAEPEETESVFRSSSEREDHFIWTFLGHPLTQFVGFALFVTLVVLILMAGLDLHGPRRITQSDIGQPAPYDVKANHQLAYTKRNLALDGPTSVDSKLRPVFDWQQDLSRTKRDNIHQAFSSMREILIEKAASTANASRQREDALGLVRQFSEFQRRQIARDAKDETFDKPLGQTLPDSAFNEFAEHSFNAEIENALATIVGDLLDEYMISNDLGKLDDFKTDNVVLRRLSGRQIQVQYQLNNAENKITPPDQIPSLVREKAQRLDIFFADKGLYNALLATAARLIEPNTTYNKAETLAQRQRIARNQRTKSVQRTIQKGEVIVAEGDIISDEDFEIIEKMYEETSSLNRVQVVTGLALLTLLFIVSLFVFGKQNIRTFDPDGKDVVFMGTALLTFLFITWIGTEIGQTITPAVEFLEQTDLYYLLPVAAGGMLVRLVLKNEHAVLFTILFSLLVSLVTGRSVQLYTYTLLGTLAGIGAVQQVKHRMALVWSGLIVGGINALVVVAFFALEGELFNIQTLEIILFAGLSGILSGLTVLALLPVFEAIFDYTTDIKLLELANLNHPLLRQLIVRASGTYHHSMMVGSLSEAAAESIGANALLCRVAAYYHDIGKAKNPHYFVENQRLGENPHDDIKPNMSALIIKAHVKDGLEMAKQHGLPKEIQDFIAQHHGTSLIAYFYREAKKQEDPDIPEVKEEDFRYPGPKPQTKETAICMLADASEAASRALPNPSPSRLRKLVRDIINKVFRDGQLDECDLTFKDLNSIANAFTRILTGIYHHRPQYPSEAKKPDQKDSDESDEQSVEETETERQNPQKQSAGQHQQQSDPPREAETYVTESETGD